MAGEIPQRSNDADTNVFLAILFFYCSAGPWADRVVRVRSLLSRPPDDWIPCCYWYWLACCSLYLL